jgi:hypothetical protein
MVQEFINHAHPVDDVSKLVELGVAPELVAKHLARVFAECAFIHGA